MEKGENYDEIFDLKPIFPEIYSSNGNTKPQVSNNGRTSPPQIKNSPISWSSASSYSPPPSVPKLISFENSTTAADTMDYKPTLDMANDYSLTSDIINFSSSAIDDSGSNDEYYTDSSKVMSHKSISPSIRTPSQVVDHVMAERKRRENLSQLFISLSKAVPGLKKLDKASLLEDGINYLKTLQERVRDLEEEEERRSSIDAVDSSSYNAELDCPEIQARISDKHVLIKIFCKKKMGLMSRIPCEIMEKMHLNVMDMRIMPFGGTDLDITILAEMQREFEVSVKDIIDHLHALF